MTPVFLDYDQERLDYHIDVRRRVPEFSVFSDRFAERSAALRGRTRCHLDLRYGPHPRERLDIFLPAGITDPVPANLFFHGGYWRSSEKERYSYVADLLLPAGAASVVVEYALIPDVDLDELVRQCRAALAWVHANGPEFAIDPARLFVSGHSAGGQIVGMLATAGWHDDFGLPVDAIRGVCGISGLYDLEPIRLSYLNSTLGLDADTARSQQSGVPAGRRTGAVHRRRRWRRGRRVPAPELPRRGRLGPLGQRHDDGARRTAPLLGRRGAGRRVERAREGRARADEARRPLTGLSCTTVPEQVDSSAEIARAAPRRSLP